MSETRKCNVFLGGTCNGSTWRDKIIPKLTIDYFNPVVEDWNEEAYNNELKHRKEDDFLLYVITPKMTGVYAIAELIDDSNKCPERVIVCILREDDDSRFDDIQWKSLSKVIVMASKNGAITLGGLEEVITYLNAHGK